MIDLTFVVRGEAEHVEVVLVLVPQPVVADARHRVPAAAGFPRGVDGVLDRPVAQPTGVAPVHPSSPRVIQLVEGSHDGVLLATRSLGVVEVKVVAPEAGVVGEEDTCAEGGGL